MGFGNGVPTESYRLIDVPRAVALARWVLLLRPRPPAPAALHESHLAFEDPTSHVVTGPPRSPSGSFLGVGGSPRFVFRVRRSQSSRFDFVSVGRNDGNDVVLPDPSVSRFHAFLREMPDGTLQVQDARSANGTFVGGIAVARQGVGPPVTLRSGDSIRFGDVHGNVVDAAGLVELARTFN